MAYERKKILPPNTTVFEVEKGYKGAHFDHFTNFFTAIREKKISGRRCIVWLSCCCTGLALQR